MARSINRLSARKVSTVSDPGKYADGGGLNLQVSGSGSKSWIFRFMLNGRAREMGLGPYHTISLLEARAMALECRKQALMGIDPIEQRKHERLLHSEVNLETVSFKDCAEKYISAKSKEWTNDKHRKQWISTLETFVYPVFGDLAVSLVDTDLIMEALEPIWVDKTETASRVRGRIESILDWATTKGHRRGENPARLKGHLGNLLPKQSKIHAVEHHKALAYADICGFLTLLKGCKGVSARGLEFLILTAARTNEVIGAKWTEIDLIEKTWTLAAERMKNGKEQRVPLSPSACNILIEMNGIRTSVFVFPGGRRNQPLSNMAFLQLLKRMEHTAITVHGFRSTFRDWVADETDFPNEVAEMALAHSVSDKVEAAYRRSDMFERRRHMMNAWATYCSNN